jgi:hypothetical protein
MRKKIKKAEIETAVAEVSRLRDEAINMMVDLQRRAAGEEVELEVYQIYLLAFISRMATFAVKLVEKVRESATSFRASIVLTEMRGFLGELDSVFSGICTNQEVEESPSKSIEEVEG